MSTPSTHAGVPQEIAVAIVYPFSDICRRPGDCQDRAARGDTGDVNGGGAGLQDPPRADRVSSIKPAVQETLPGVSVDREQVTGGEGQAGETDGLPGTAVDELRAGDRPGQGDLRPGLERSGVPCGHRNGLRGDTTGESHRT